MDKQSAMVKKIKEEFPLSSIAVLLLGTAILTFGLHNIHRQGEVTEGGVLGLVLLLDHLFHLPPSRMTPILDLICYGISYRFLGGWFILRSLIATAGMTFFFTVWEQFPPILNGAAYHPLWSAILGGIFVGIGVGLVVRQGGSSGGDDGLALVIAKLTGLRLAKAYLITDLTVLLLSLTYIPFHNIFYSLVTVTLSSWIIDGITQRK